MQNRSGSSATTIRLQDGTLIPNCEKKIVSYCNGGLKKRKDYSYKNYDKPAASPETLTFDDIQIANRMQARIPTTVQKSILDKSNEIERALKSIPPESDLIDWHKWDGLTQLFRIFTEINGVKLARATKILHKKRPQLIPILDSVIQKYVREVPNDSSLETEDYAKFATSCCKIIQNDLKNNHNALSTIRIYVRETDGIELTRLRILDILLWQKRSSTSR